MFSAKKIVKAASMGKKKTPCISSSVEKGHFVVYTVDRVRFMMRLWYLQHEVFQELLRMSGEEFGISSEGPITVPCDAASLEYVVSLIKGGVVCNLDIKALVDSIAASTCSDHDFANSDQEAATSSSVHVY